MMSYEETEKSWEGDDLNIYISRTEAIDIIVETGGKRERFRANLVPLFTFMKQQLKNVDWEHISRTRDTKWGYKRIEPEELFDMLNDRRSYDDNR
jgi:hypothetical protein|tara:strand:- start:1724 stop:2008 length:285 start_codon:yes stop_codon:yes gene_type:complete